MFETQPKININELAKLTLGIDLEKVDMSKLESLRKKANMSRDDACRILGATDHGWDLYVLNSRPGIVNNYVSANLPSLLEALGAKPEDIYIDEPST